MKSAKHNFIPDRTRCSQNSTRTCLEMELVFPTALNLLLLTDAVSNKKETS